MTQYQGNRPRRPLTPEQKRRIIQLRKKRRMMKRLKIIIPAAVLVIVLAVILICVLGGGEDPAQDAVQAAAMLEATAQADATVEPVPVATPEPVEVFDYDKAYIKALKGEVTGPEVVYDYSEIDPNMRSRWTDAQPGYIPVLRQANTNEKIIAVTVDDCFQGSNFMKIVQCAINNDAKLTIFPIGKNLKKEEVASALRLAYDNGMEIGNHTYNHSGMFHYDQERMMNEIWYQRQAVNSVLGLNYDQHFFRPRGGDERGCQRMHAYLNQLDYSGVAMWTNSGSNEPLNSLYNTLAPGKVYLFHTTDNDLKKLLQFIPEVTARGYRLVTMSEMFGLPQNEVSELKMEYEYPEFKSFNLKPDDLARPVYKRAVAVVQQRLIDLGWMDGEATGTYGEQTMMAVGFFQKAVGLEVTGNADVELQKLMFSDQAPRGSLSLVQQYCRDMGKKVLNQLPGTTNDEA